MSDVGSATFGRGQEDLTEVSEGWSVAFARVASPPHPRAGAGAGGGRHRYESPSDSAVATLRRNPPNRPGAWRVVE